MRSFGEGRPLRNRSRSVTAPAASRADVEPVANENLHRTVNGLVTVVPFLLLGVAAWQVWDRLLGASIARCHGLHSVLRHQP